MPVISMFYGIIVRMYFMDTKQHKRPHIHAEYAGSSAVFALDDGEILAGKLPSKQVRLVQAWIELRREDLQADWQLRCQRRAGIQDRAAQVRKTNPKVRRVRALPGYKLDLTFDNGQRKQFDLSPYLDTGVFRQLRDPSTFQSARVVAGSVEWTGEIDLSYDTLYLEGTFGSSARSSSTRARPRSAGRRRMC